MVAGVRQGRVRAAARPDERPGEDRVRLPHHQGDREEGRRRTKTLAEVRPQIEDQLKWRAGADRGAEARRPGRRRAEEAGGLRHRGAARAGCRVGESGLFPQDEPIAGLGMAPAGRPDGVRAEGRRGQRAAAHAAGLRVHHRHRQAGRRTCPKLDEVKTKVRDDVLKKKAIDAARQKAAVDRAAAEVGRLREGRQGRRPRGEDHRADRARRADRRRRRQPGARRRGLRAARRRRQRPDRHRHRRRHREGARAQGRRRRRAREAEGLAARTSSSTSGSNKFFAAYMTKARERMKVNINRAMASRRSRMIAG